MSTLLLSPGEMRWDEMRWVQSSFGYLSKMTAASILPWNTDQALATCLSLSDTKDAKLELISSMASCANRGIDEDGVGDDDDDGDCDEDSAVKNRRVIISVGVALRSNMKPPFVPSSCPSRSLAIHSFRPDGFFRPPPETNNTLLKKLYRSTGSLSSSAGMAWDRRRWTWGWGWRWQPQHRCCNESLDSANEDEDASDPTSDDAEDDEDDEDSTVALDRGLTSVRGVTRTISIRRRELFFSSNVSFSFVCLFVCLFLYFL